MRRPYSHTYTHRCSDTHNTHYSLKRAVTTQHDARPSASGAQIGLARRTSLTPHTEAQPAETQAGQHVTIRHATRGQTTPQRKRHRRHIDHARTRRTNTVKGTQTCPRGTPHAALQEPAVSASPSATLSSIAPFAAAVAGMAESSSGSMYHAKVNQCTPDGALLPHVYAQVLPVTHKILTQTSR